MGERADPPRELRYAGHGGDAVGALLFEGSRAEEPRPGVVLVHAGRGLSACERGAARRLAGAGYAVIAPDLHARAGAAPAGATAPAAELPDRRALGDLEAAAAALVADGGVDPERVAALGIGAGGALAFLFGCASTRVAAVVDFGGPIVYPELSAAKPVQPLELALNLGAPLCAFFGERDPATPPEHVARLRTALSQFAKDFEIATYPAAGQGFMDEQARGYDAAAATDAWRRTLAFLEQRLV